MSKAQIEAVQEMLTRDLPPEELPTAEKKHADKALELSAVQYKPLSWFKPNANNEVFRSLKTQQYWQDLEKDIRETGVIKSPAIAMQDGLLIEGESRLTVAQKLDAEAVPGFDKLPVRIVLSTLSAKEQKKLLYLGNLDRFEIDSATRIALYGEIYPGYFSATDRKGGRPKKGELSSPFPSTARQVAKALGKTERQVQKDKLVYQKAKKHALQHGRKAPTPADVKSVKKLQSEKAKKRATRELAAPTRYIVLQLTKVEADETLTALSTKPSALRRQIISKIRKAKAS